MQLLWALMCIVVRDRFAHNQETLPPTNFNTITLRLQYFSFFYGILLNQISAID